MTKKEKGHQKIGREQVKQFSVNDLQNLEIGRRKRNFCPRVPPWLDNPVGRGPPGFSTTLGVDTTSTTSAITTHFPIS